MSASTTSERTAVDVVGGWLEAVNATDPERVMALSAPDVEIVGPRGIARGREALREWLLRANARFETRGVLGERNQVIVEQLVTWPTATGQAQADVVSRFEVEAGLIRKIQRYDTLSEALVDAGLGSSHGAPLTVEFPSTLPTVHRDFLSRALSVLQQDTRLVGVAAGGSYLENAMDEFSDLDLIIVAEPTAYSEVLEQRLELAARLGGMLAAFTGEHVGEPRLLICLYGPSLLHVDLKFVSLAALASRVEDPRVLWQRDGRLSAALAEGEAHFPEPDPRWIEDRFWVWVHYAAAKLGRGELFELVQFLAFLRNSVLGPLALQSVRARPSGVRRIERVAPELAQRLARTLSGLDASECARALRASIALYLSLRSPELESVSRAERPALDYLGEVERRLGLHTVEAGTVGP